MRAMGNPVALEASADERDTRGFISITSCSPVAGSTANWMLQPPAATPISRMIRMAASRMLWYSRSVSVMAGATVIESPVCTPIGSKFSMEQTITTLSARSRMTSSSYSFQPRIDSSIRTSVVGLKVAACLLHAVLLNHPVLVHRHRRVQRGLAAEGGQQGVRPLVRDHLG